MPFGQAAPSMNGLDQLTSGMDALKSGLGSLFDPSKVAHAGYYGAEARRAMLQGDETVNKLNLQPYLLSQLFGSPVAPFSGNFSPMPGRAPGSSGMVFQPTPGSIPMAPAQVPTAPPQGMAPPGQPAMPPQPVAPPQGAAQPPPGPSGGFVDAGTWDTAPPPLSSTITPGGSLPMMDTASVGRTLSPGDSPLNTGVQPPPASPPSPGAPPAPNTTASNGTVPATDGRLHPGSVQAPDGGVKMSGPASPNGSPAPPINLGPMMAIASMTGMDAATQANLMRGYVNDAVSRGVIDQATANQILERATVITDTGATTRQDSVNRTNITTTGMNNQSAATREQAARDDALVDVVVNGVHTKMTAGALKKAGMGPDGKPIAAFDSPSNVATITGQTAREADDRTLGDVVVGGKPTQMTRGEQRALPPEQRPPSRQPAVEQTTITQQGETQRAEAARQAALVWTKDPTGGFRRMTMKEAQDQKLPIVDDKTAEAGMAHTKVYAQPGDVDEGGNQVPAGQPITIPAWQAEKERRKPVPGSVGEAEGGAAGYAGGAGVAGMRPPPGSTPEQSARAAINRQNTLNRRYPPQVGSIPDRNIDRVEFGGTLAARVDALTRKHFADKENPNTYQNDNEAYGQALDDLTASGDIPNPEQVRRPELWNYFAKNVVTRDGEKVLIIHENMLPKNTLKETITSGATPTNQSNNMTPAQMYGGTTAPAAPAPTTPAAPAAPAPTAGGGRAIGRAPPGTPDGPVMGRDGKPMGINRGGVIYQ